MNYEDKVLWLSRYKELDLRIRFLTSNLYGIKGVSYETKIHSSSPQTIEDKIFDIDDLKRKRKEIEDIIAAVENEKYKSILYYVYIYSYTIQRVADMNLMGYSYSSLRRIHHEAIDSLDI